MTKIEKVRINVEIDAAAYTEKKKREIEKIARLCFLMDEKYLHRLYITALNMI